MNEREKDLHAEELADLARRLEGALDVEAPDARSEKALFVAGVGSRRARRSPWPAALVPATAAVAVLVVLAVVSRTALPGQALYPVRQVLGNVGLAPSTAREARVLLDEAEQLVVEAEGATLSAPTRAQDLARRALAKLEEAEELAGELDGARAESFDRSIDALADRADDAYDAADDTLDEREEAEDDSTGSGSDDSSGPGSDDDSSGSGSGGGVDSSAPGSGGDDSSGSGSGGEDDSSGSGSGGDDSSGSGSGGGGDSSGKGSGDHD